MDREADKARAKPTEIVRQRAQRCGDTEREKWRKWEKNLNRATCSGRSLSAEKVYGLDFSQ